MKLSYYINIALTAFRLGFREVMAMPLLTLGQLVTLAITVTAYTNVFKSIPAEDLLRHHLTSAQLIWYMTSTEFMIFSIFGYFTFFTQEITAENGLAALIRPCPLWLLKIGEWSGQVFARFAILALPVSLLAGMLSHNFGLILPFLGALMFGYPLAAILNLCVHYLIGAASLRFRANQPFFWIYQKLMFLFGALMWPFAFYPDILREAAWFLPFRAVLAAPAEWVLQPPASFLLRSLLHQAFWLALLLLTVHGVTKVMLRATQRQAS